MTVRAAALLVLVSPQVSIEASAFPPGAPTPGYAGVRVRIASAADLRHALRVRSADGSTTEVELDVRAGTPRDVALAVWRADERPVEVSFADGSRSVDPGPPRPMALAVGGLPEAEAASDAFESGLREILVTDRLPELLDPAALDGFSGLMPPGVPAQAAEGFRARGGAVGSGPFRAPRAPVLVAAAIPASGLAPRDVFGPGSPPVRLALAGTIAAAAAALLLRRRPVLAITAGVALALGAAALCFAASRARAPSILVEAAPGADLELRPGPARGERAGEGLEYPCGARGALSRALRGGGGSWSSPVPVLLAFAAASPPTPAPRELDPIDPLAEPGSVRRALALAAPGIAGAPAAALLDRPRGRIVVRRAGSPAR